MNTQFGPAYPKLAQINNQLKEIDAQLLAETKKLSGKIKGQYMAALQREDMLRDALEKQKQEANKLNESAIDTVLLKRDLDTNRQLYEGLLEKLKEAGVLSRSPFEQLPHRRRSPRAHWPHRTEYSPQSFLRHSCSASPQE